MIKSDHPITAACDLAIVAAGIGVIDVAIIAALIAFFVCRKVSPDYAVAAASRLAVTSTTIVFASVAVITNFAAPCLDLTVTALVGSAAQTKAVAAKEAIATVGMGLAGCRLVADGGHDFHAA